MEHEAKIKSTIHHHITAIISNTLPTRLLATVLKCYIADLINCTFLYLSISRRSRVACMEPGRMHIASRLRNDTNSFHYTAASSSLESIPLAGSLILLIIYNSCDSRAETLFQLYSLGPPLRLPQSKFYQQPRAKQFFFRCFWRF